MDHITLKALAAEIGMDRSHLRKFVLGLGIEPMRIRNAQSRNQAMLALTVAEAERVKAARAEAGFTSATTSIESQTLGRGQFYIVIPDPEMRPNRVKVGFTRHLNARMDAYRTSSPGVEMLKAWPCQQGWEQAAIAAVTNADGCELVAGEVYDCLDAEVLLGRADALFAMLP